jgi:hypothetical protein
MSGGGDDDEPRKSLAKNRFKNQAYYSRECLCAG